MAVFLQDNFNDTNGTALTAHTVSGSGAAGGAWVALTGNLQTATIDSNRVHSASTGTGVSLYYNAATPASADYIVEVDAKNLGSGVISENTGPMARASTSAETFYDFILGADGTIQMYKVVATSFTQLGSTVTISGGGVTNETYRIILDVSGGSTTLLNGRIQRYSDGMWVNPAGNWQSTPVNCIVYSDNGSVGGPAITAANKAGIYVSASTTAGMPAVFVTAQLANKIAINDSNLFFTPGAWNASGSTYNQAISPGAALKTGFSGTSANLGVDVTPLSGGGSSAGHYPYCRWTIDNGVYSANVQLVSGQNQIPLARGLAAGTHSLVFEVVALSNDDRWTTPEDVLRLTSLQLDNGASTSAPTLLSKRIAGYGDSITQGNLTQGVGSAPSDDDGFLTWLAFLAYSRGAEFSAIGYASQGYTVSGQGNVPPFFTVGNDTLSAWNKYYSGTSRLSGGLYSPALDEIWIAHGQNDNAVSAGTLATVVAAALTAIRTAAGSSTLIWVVIPFSGDSRTGITNGFNSYQVATPDAKCFLIDPGTDAFFTASTPTAEAPNDGVHPWYRTSGTLASVVEQKAQAAGGGLPGYSRSRVVNG